jgi:uncharacterized protein (TIGR03083 family)
MPDTTAWISAVRNSHTRLADLLEGLDDDGVKAPSYASDWTIADVASHLGSQAEIFGLFLGAGLTGEPAPGGDVFPPIWDRWNALAPAEQVTQSVTANEAFVTRLEQIPPAEASAFAMSMFGSDIDLAGLAAMRLGEHALHTWDVAVALDPMATVSPDAVALLVDTVATVAGRAGKPLDDVDPIAIETTDPGRRFVLTVAPEVTLVENDAPGSDALQLPAEALIRLVYGRLDPEHSPTDDARLTEARRAFPGF